MFASPYNFRANNKRKTEATEGWSKTCLLACLVLIHITQAYSQSSFIYNSCENAKGNYTTKSTYKANLNRVLSVLSSADQGIDNGRGFYSSSSSFYGQSDEIYVAGLCRGDVESDACSHCLSEAVHILSKICPNQKEAIGGFDECLLRYSNESSSSLLSSHPRLNLWDTKNVSPGYANVFLRSLRELLSTLKKQASIKGHERKFAMGNESILGFRTIHAFVQCTPDLSRRRCEGCLEEAFGDISSHNGSIGGRVITPTCNFRYEVYNFLGRSYNASLTSRLQSTIRSSSQPSSNKGKKSNKSRTIIIISTVVPSALVLGLIISIGVYTRVKKSSGQKVVAKSLDIDPVSEPTHNKRARFFRNPWWRSTEEIGPSKCTQLDFVTIKRATNNFSAHNIIHKGSFGDDIYRGTLPDGQRIMVKRLGLNSKRNFESEIEALSKLQHRNVVRLLDSAVKGDESLLVYEFLPKSLNRCIFGEEANLDWDTLHSIIKGVARGLLYLHEDCLSTIVHRDIKPGTIMLDENMNPKISEFGLAKLLESGQSEESTEIAGTLGYIPAEYAMRGTMSAKVDVYGFGVVLLEILCGRKNVSFEEGFYSLLLDEVERNWRYGSAWDLVSHHRTRNGSESEKRTIMKCVHVGLLCVQEDYNHRPTMDLVLHMLCCDSVSLPDVGKVRSDNMITRDSDLSSDSLSMIAESHSGVTRNGIHVVVLCWRFIKNLRRMADLRRSYNLP